MATIFFFCGFRYMKSPESHNIIPPKGGVELWGSWRDPMEKQKEHLTHHSPKAEDSTPTIPTLGWACKNAYMDLNPWQIVAHQFWTAPPWLASKTPHWSPCPNTSSLPLPHSQSSCNQHNSEFCTVMGMTRLAFLAIITCLARGSSPSVSKNDLSSN